MIALDKDTLEAVVRLMGDDVPAGFGELAMLSYGPDSAWARTEPYDGPCLHDLHWGVQCGSCPHEGECGPFPSTFELLVLDYLTATGRQPADLGSDVRGDEGRGLEIPF
jgi:hypothetical protein